MYRYFSLSVFFAVLLALPLVQSTMAQEEAGEKPSFVESDLVEAEATVEAINKEKRLVVLRRSDGKAVTVEAHDRVRNFDQIEIGDKVVVEYYESVAVYVTGPGQEPSASEISEVGVAPKGEKPGIGAVDTIKVTATVEDINYKTRKVTLKGPEGNTVTIKVPESRKNLENVKKGDTVVMRYTEAVAISVRKP